MTEATIAAAPARGGIDRTKPPVIRAEGVWKVFGPRGERLVGSPDAYLPRGELREKTGCVVAVRDVSLEVWPGEVFVVMGLSGSGKSTLVRTLIRLIEPTAGSIEIAGHDVMAAGKTELRELRRHDVARAFAVNPKVMLYDEPFSALDPLIRRDMQDEVCRLQEETGKTMVFITHDLPEALRLGDRIAIMRNGRFVQVGTPEELVGTPADDYVANFVRDIPRTHVLTLRWIMRAPKPGEVSSDIELDVTTKVKDAVPVVAGTSGPVREVEGGRVVG